MTIPSYLYSRLRTTLLTCWSFESDYQLSAVFLDPRRPPAARRPKPTACACCGC